LAAGRASWCGGTLGGLLAGAKNAEEAAYNGKIRCALKGAKAFSATCTFDVDDKGDETIIVVHHPDGGFRRLRLLQNDAEAVDGADRAVVWRGNGLLEIMVGSDRYDLTGIRIFRARDLEFPKS
jgi:hypothetical protein